jgi:hypothetical protein
LDVLTTLKNSGGIAAAQHKKIVEDNRRAFCGLGEPARYQSPLTTTRACAEQVYR